MNSTHRTEHPAAPTTEAGRTLEREIGGDYGEEIAGIEAEARAAARKEVLDEVRTRLDNEAVVEFSDGDGFDIDDTHAILDSLSTDTREEPSDG